MTLDITISQAREGVTKVALRGRLDTNTSPQLERQLDGVLSSDHKRLIFDLAQLEYISSAGLRTIFRAKKSMEGRGGSIFLVHIQPSVQKVFDVVKALPGQAIFRTWQEMDEYLDAIQRKAREDD